MRSLRSRLILGSALVAVVPLAVAMLLLSRRIETLVRTQATERLDAALGTLAARLEGDRARVAERLEILGAEPQLKRLYLVRPAGTRDLADYLGERRILLGLDFLRVVDTTGVTVAEDAAGTARIGAPESEARAPIRYERAGSARSAAAWCWTARSSSGCGRPAGSSWCCSTRRATPSPPRAAPRRRPRARIAATA